MTLKRQPGRPRQPQVAGQCEGSCGAGLLEVWVTRRGRLVLVCDECDAAWFDPENVTGANFTVPDSQTFALDDGDVIDHLADPHEVEAGGWAPYVEAWARLHG